MLNILKDKVGEKEVQRRVNTETYANQDRKKKRETGVQATATVTLCRR